MHVALAEQQEAAKEPLKGKESAQKPAAMEAADEEDKSLLFFAMRTVDAPKLASAAQKAAELQAQEVGHHTHSTLIGFLCNISQSFSA